MYYFRAATDLEYYRGPDSHDIPCLSYYWVKPWKNFEAQ